MLNIDALNRRGRRTVRLSRRDYAEGWYFVTICTRGKEDLFGHIMDGAVSLNIAGLLVHFRWQWLQWFYPYVQLDEWIVMSDHLHGIVRLMGKRAVEGACRGAWPRAPTGPIPVSLSAMYAPSPLWSAPFAVTGKQKPLGQLIGAFKTTTTMAIRALPDFGQEIFVWQRNYHERVIRSDAELQQIRRYIRENPERWEGNA